MREREREREYSDFNREYILWFQILVTLSAGSDDLVINGGKMWTTTGLQADWMCLLANTRDGPPHRNKSLICLPMKTKGVSTKKIDKIGNHSSDTAMVFFEDVVVPRRNIIGEEGMGFTYQMLQFQEERMWGNASGQVAGERPRGKECVCVFV